VANSTKAHVRAMAIFSAATILPAFKDRRLSEINYEAVMQWRDRLRASPEQLKLAKPTT